MVMHVELHAVAVMHARLCTAARMHVALHTVAIKPVALHAVAGSVGQHAAIVSVGLHAIAANNKWAGAWQQESPGWHNQCKSLGPRPHTAAMLSETMPFAT